MDEKEKQKFREHYSSSPNATLLELLKGGEAGLIEGAYGLVKDEAIRRKLVDSGLKIMPEKPIDMTRCKEDSNHGGWMSPKAAKTTAIILKVFIFFVGCMLSGFVREFEVGMLGAFIVIVPVLMALRYKWETLWIRK